jgi:sortase A
VGYIYLKDNQPEAVSTSVARLKLEPKYRKILAGAFFAFGIFLFSSAVFPIIQFQLEYSIKFNQILNPLSSKFYNPSGGILGDVSTDYTQLNNWFVRTDTGDNNPQSVLTDNPSSEYTISIPKLKIQDAVVEVGSMDLKKSLIQYPQTALPGQLGNGVIFGHSVLPQFFNPKSYLTIFSTLHRLKQGDEIFIDYDNILYKYLVEEMYEVSPTDLSVLEQRYDGRYMNLITCSPPGTYLRRLVIKARIVDI